MGAINTPAAGPALFVPQLFERAIPLLARLERTELEGFIAIAIELLDTLDGNPDVELNGDELDGTGGEDDFKDHSIASEAAMPGCPVSDPDCSVEDDPHGIDPEEDVSADDQGEEEELHLTPDWRMDQRQSLPDHMVLAADREAMAVHRDRLQRDRCLPRYRRSREWGTGEVRQEVVGYELIVPPETPSRRQLLKRKRGVPREPGA